MAKKTYGKKKKPEKPEEQKTDAHEIFTARRLIIFFATLEILIILLMYPTYRGRRHMNLAKTAAAKKEFEKAYKHYKWLGQNTPAAESATYHLELGNVCMGLKKFEEAAGHFKIVVEKTEAQEGSNSLVGLAYIGLGNTGEARKYFRKELEKFPTDHHANYNLGKIAFEEKKYTEATAYFSRVAFLPEYKNALRPYWRTLEKEVLQK